MKIMKDSKLSHNVLLNVNLSNLYGLNHLKKYQFEEKIVVTISNALNKTKKLVQNLIELSPPKLMDFH